MSKGCKEEGIDIRVVDQRDDKRPTGDERRPTGDERRPIGVIVPPIGVGFDSKTPAHDKEVTNLPDL